MNYLRELNAFRDWALLNRPSTGQVALWHSLMSVNNMSGWINWFTVPNQTLQLMTGLSRQGLDKARVGLINQSLIEYRKGSSNQAGRYKMVSLLECQKVGTEVDTTVGTAVVTVAAHQEAQQRRGGSTLFKQEVNETKTQRELACAQIVQAYEQTCGVLRGESDKLNQMLEYFDAGLAADVITLALTKSRDADSPAAYALGILDKWNRKGVKTIDDANRESERQDSGTWPRRSSVRRQVTATESRTQRIVPSGQFGRID